MSNSRRIKRDAPSDQELAGKWERADNQLTILVGAAAADLLGQPPHTVALSLARLLHQRHDADTILGYAAVAITRLGMAKKAQLEATDPSGSSR
jgi:hypothetical protein